MCADVGFIPVDRPGHEGTGSVRTASHLIRALSQHHDLTVYVFSPHPVDRTLLPASEAVTYRIVDDLSLLPEPKTSTIRAMKRVQDDLEDHDLVHSYDMNGIVGLASLSTPTLVSLNAYDPICPKGDLRWRGRETCEGASVGKCSACITADTLTARSVSTQLAKDLYKYHYRLSFVRQANADFDLIDRYHAIAPHVARTFASHGIDRSRIDTIVHFYDDDFLPSASTTSVDSETIELLSVGHLKRHKGVQTVIRALPAIISSHPAASLRIVGTGPYRDRLEALADAVGVTDHVIWEGYVDYENLPELYAAADVFVYPGTWDEPFGRVLLESLAAGTPVVGSDVGSVAEIVGDAGVTFTAGEPDALARALTTVLESVPRFRDAIDAELARFERSSVVEQFNAVYERLSQ